MKMFDMREPVMWIFVADVLVTDGCVRTPKRKAELILSDSSASGAAGGSDTKGKAAKGSGERGGSRESFKSAVVKKCGGLERLDSATFKNISRIVVGPKP